jgi:ribonuclease-3
MNNLYSELQKNIGYEFKDINLLKQALTHISFANDNNCKSYERLEFLGDAVIELVVSHYIYSKCDIDSGELSKLRAKMVSTENFNQISIDLMLEKYCLKGKSLPKLSKKNTADLFESCVGAIYLDGGMQNAEKVINKFIIKDFSNIKKYLNLLSDPKSEFQEYCQGKNISFEYKVLESSGLDHEKVFKVGLYLQGELLEEAMARSIQSAEEECARRFLENKKN